MAPHPDYPRTRLFTNHALDAGCDIMLEDTQAHYLMHVLRLREGEEIALFNGRDGEWRGNLYFLKKQAGVSITAPLRPQVFSPDIWLLAAPLKQGGLEQVTQKATELGISAVQPVLTQHCIASKVNISRLQTIAIEAAEQCERLDVPEVKPLMPLAALLDGWDETRLILLGDESGASPPIADVLRGLQPSPTALLIGPEGGFSKQELEKLHSLPYIRGVSMGPRIMRADTAALSLLACIQAHIGDWNDRPYFRSQR